MPRYETIHITQRTRGTKQSPCLFRLKFQLLHSRQLDVGREQIDIFLVMQNCP